jgi:hypothetical protein
MQTPPKICQKTWEDVKEHEERGNADTWGRREKWSHGTWVYVPSNTENFSERCLSMNCFWPLAWTCHLSSWQSIDSEGYRCIFSPHVKTVTTDAKAPTTQVIPTLRHFTERLVAVLCSFCGPLEPGGKLDFWSASGALWNLILRKMSAHDFCHCWSKRRKCSNGRLPMEAVPPN